MSDPTPTNTSTPAGGENDAQSGNQNTVIAPVYPDGMVVAPVQPPAADSDAQTENQHTPVDPTGARFPVNKDEEVAPRVDAVIETFEGDPNDTKSRELIEAAIPPCERYDLEINVVTRLAGIPVKGVKIERAVRNSDSEFHKIGNYLADLTESKLVLKVTYANEKEHLKPEVVTITLADITPHSCVAAGRAKANFEYSIINILEAKNLPAGESHDFTDKDEVVAAKYTTQQSYTTPSLIVENSFTVEEQPDGSHPTKVIFHLNVSLATFSLKVPYVNQNAGFVRVAPENDVHSIGYARPWTYDNYITTNPWSGECLCAPTSATMVLMYYGILTSDKATPEPANHNVTQGVLNRAGLMTRFKFNNPADDPAYRRTPWEIAANMEDIIKNKIYEEKRTHDNAIYSTDRVLFQWNTQRPFDEQMEAVFPVLEQGDPLYAGILGDHVLVIRGAVVSKEKKIMWAICNDPYGTMAGPESNYADTSYSEMRYAHRKERNTVNNDSDDTPGSRKGKHVYYKGTTHFVLVHPGEPGFRFRYIYQFHYRNEHDKRKSNRTFASERLVRGEP